MLFLADILPTSYKVGVVNGRVTPGDTVAIVGAGPIRLAAIMTARLHTPGRVISIDLAEARLDRARDFGADVTINNGSEDAIAQAVELTGGLGADVAIQAVGVPATLELCTEFVRAGAPWQTWGVHGLPARTSREAGAHHRMKPRVPAAGRSAPTVGAASVENGEGEGDRERHTPAPPRRRSYRRKRGKGQPRRNTATAATASAAVPTTAVNAKHCARNTRPGG